LIDGLSNKPLPMKLLLPLATLLLLSFSSWAQLSYTESFETNGEGTRYTSTAFDNRAPGNNTEYFTREDNPVQSLNGTLTFTNPVGNVNGNFFWACEGVKGRFSSTRPAGTVTLNPLTVAGYSGLTVTVAFADARATAPTAEPGDFMRVQYSYDNINYTTIGEFTGTAVGGSAWRRVGTSADLTTSLQDFAFTIGTPSGPTLYVRVQADYFGASKEIAFDNIRVTGSIPAVAPPVLANIESTSVAYAEGAASVQLTNSLTVTNPSNATLSGATVQLQANLGILSTSDVLSFTPNSTISGSYNTATRLLTLTGTASTANYQAALRSVRYVNTDAINATPGTRTAVFTVLDGSRSSAIASRNIVVTASLNGPTALNYTESFETNGEGTRYGSNTYNQNSQAFIRTSQNPVSGVSTTTYANIEQSGYWYAEGTKDNATGAVGTLQLAPVNATSFRDLHFIWRVGRGGNGWQPNDYVRLYYDAGSGSQLFGAFYGTGGSTPEVRRDADLDGIADATGTLLTSTLQEIDFTLPAALANQPDIDFRIDVANNGGEELAFDYIRITGVSNRPPIINAQTFSLAENSANNTVVGTVVASDPDAGQTLTYAITAGNTGGAFSINSSTGQLRVANSAVLNFETTPSFALTVQVTDNAPSPLSASNTVTINLTNVNEAPVVAAQTFSLAENSANGTAVGTIVASDPDTGTTLTYALTAGNTSGAFALNAATGQLTVANTAALDFETTLTFTLTVSVSDGGLVTTATITINLIDVPNAAYLSSTAEQITRSVAAGSTNEAILRIPVVLNGNTDQPLSATSFTFSTAGTTVPANVAAARIYYTGTSGTFATTTLFGSITAPGSGAIVVSGSQVLQPNTNYFWLAYDVAPNALNGNLLDATFTSLTVGGINRTPLVTNPAGSREIFRTDRVAGTALRFVGGNTPGTINFSADATNPAPILGPQYTQAIWLKPATGTGSTTYYVLGNGTGNTAAPYIFVTGNGRLGAGFGTGSGTVNQQTGPNTIAAGEWSHVAATYNGSALIAYLNGVAVINLPVNSAVAATPINFLGNVAVSSSNNFPGDIDEVSQWNRALSQTEVRLLRHLTLQGTESGLVSYLQFNDQGTTTTDVVRGTVGTLTSGLTRISSSAPVSFGTSNVQTVTGIGTYSFSGTNVSISFSSTGGAPHEVVVSRLSGPPLGVQPSTTGLQRTFNQAYWIVNRYSSSDFTATVTYTISPADISPADAATPANLKLFKRGSNSDAAFEPPISAVSASATNGTVTFPVTSFSQTVIGTLGSSPLPVELVSFTAQAQGPDALLRWITAQEKNSAYFEVESSTDGRTFRVLHRVAGQGNSSARHQYEWIDKAVARYQAPLIYYRLRQVDLDGTVAYSPVQTVKGDVTKPSLALVPNPTHGLSTLTGAIPGAQVQVLDAVGRLVVATSADMMGTAVLVLPMGQPTGVYMVRTGTQTLRLVVD
jgi:VCBS repeat-containing protein